MSQPDSPPPPAGAAADGLPDEVEVLLADCVAGLVRNLPDRPLEAMLAYFEKANALGHVAQRGFDFVNACAHNRRAFLLAFDHAYGHLGGEVVQPQDVFHLAQLLCADFPEAVFEDVTALLQPDQQADFTIVKTTFFVQFYFCEYLQALRQHFCGTDKRTLHTSPPTTSRTNASDSRLITLQQVTEATAEWSGAGGPGTAVPHDFLAAAYRGPDERENFALSFDCFQNALVRSTDLAHWCCRPPAARRWDEFMSVREVAVLFHHAPERTTGEDPSDRTTKSTKSKSREKSKPVKKAKGTAS